MSGVMREKAQGNNLTYVEKSEDKEIKGKKQEVVAEVTGRINDEGLRNKTGGHDCE